MVAIDSESSIAIYIYILTLPTLLNVILADRLRVLSLPVYSSSVREFKVAKLSLSFFLHRMLPFRHFLRLIFYPSEPSSTLGGKHRVCVCVRVPEAPRRMRLGIDIGAYANLRVLVHETERIILTK